EYASTRAAAVRDTSASAGIPSRSASAAERRSSWQNRGYCSPHTVRFDIDAFSSGGVPAAEYSSAFVESSRLLSSVWERQPMPTSALRISAMVLERSMPPSPDTRSEEHTSELQSRFDLVCRLLLEKK